MRDKGGWFIVVVVIEKKERIVLGLWDLISIYTKGEGWEANLG